MPKQESCDERIDGQLAGRMRHIGALVDLTTVYDRARLDEVTEDAAAREALAELELGSDASFDDITCAADERLFELPLGLDTVTVTRIELSTGGPADRLEVFWRLAGESEPAEIERIVYHFADWFDHAERTLSGPDYETAAAFASRIVPELVDAAW